MTLRSLIRFRALALFGLLLLLAPGCGGGSGSPAAATPPPPPPADFLDVLRTAPGVSGVVEGASPIPGTRFFRFLMTQPVDHGVAGGPTFPQTATLLYRSRTAPVVLATTGYGISRSASQGEPTRILNANQLTLEHRFFNSSTPATLDWSKLDIQQPAADQHAVVLALKPLFSGKWLSTGGSKGGMTALFHRRFHPNDVDATLAYVAPVNLAQGDLRYIPFVDARGDSATRLALEAWQQAILDKRSEVLGLFQADATARGAAFNHLGPDRTLEFAVLESPFILWQYGNAALAAQVPPVTAPASSLYAYLNLVNSGVVDSWSDSTLDYFQAYYQQCATQLGYPAVKEAHLTGLAYPGQDLPAIYPPVGAAKAYDGGAAMQDIQAWLSASAQNVILVYGENDPWTAGALDVPGAAQARGVRKFIAPGGNHGANLAGLIAADRNEAYGLLGQWLGAPVAPAMPGPAVPSRAGADDISDTFVVRRPLR
ncbi:MAG TPA: S28 family serine protease [Geothrix sp.]|nr:S28 family serine protease [Geothrix sp.]